MSEQSVSPFAAALAKRQQADQEKKEAEERKGQNFDFEELAYFPLEDGKEKVFRIVGNPVEVRSKQDDPILILQSQVVNEKKSGYVKINWDAIQKDGKLVPNPDWVLSRLYSKVNERDWKKYTDADLDDKKGIVKAEGKIVNADGKNGEWVYRHADTQIYKIVDGNAKKDEKYPKSFYPSKRVIMNVINRHDDWCKINNHTQILTSKLGVSEKKNDKTGEMIRSLFPDTGIPETLYKAIFEHFVKSRGDWDVDAVVTKKASDKKYEVWDATDVKYLSDLAKKLASENDLTKEELAYETYDLDKLFGVSSYSKLLKRIGYLFKLCDAELGTEFFKELEQLANKEAEERKAKNEEEKSEDDAEEKHNNEDVKEDVKETSSRARGVSKPSTDTSTEEKLVEYFKTVFPKWKDLPDSDKKILITNFDKVGSNGYPDFKMSSNPVQCSNADCKFEGSNVIPQTPDTISMCPVCGEVYPEQA